MKPLKRSFQTIINGTNVWDHALDIKHEVISTSLVEGQRARIFAGLTAAEFESLPGSHTWSAEETTIGCFECKADVIMFYRTEKRSEAIIEQLSMKK